MPKNKSQRLLILVGFLMVAAILTPIFFILLKKQAERNKPRIRISQISLPPEASPINFQITNLSPSGFTVSWVSVTPGTELTNQIPIATTGKLIITQNSDIASDTSGITVNDKRGENYRGSTHYFDVRNLTPDTVYTFKIKSGTTLYSYKDNRWQINGTPQEKYLLKTLKIIGNPGQLPSAQNPYGAYSLEPGAFLPCPNGTSNPPVSCYRPNPLVFTTNPATGNIIVYLLVKNTNQNGSKISSVLTCLTESSDHLTGMCLMDMANFLKEDLSSYLAYQPGVNVLSIEWTADSHLTSPEIIKPIPEVIADTCLTGSLQCNTPPPGERVFVFNLNIPTPTSGAPTPTITSGPPTIKPTLTLTITPIPTPPVIPNTPVLNIKLNFFGVWSEPTDPPYLDYKNQEVLITLKKLSPTPTIVYQKIISFKAKTLNNSFYYENTDLINPNLPPDNLYLILIKGPKHLQIKLPRQNLVAGPQYLNLTTKEKSLPGGDLPLPQEELAQDGMVNSMDYNFLVEHFNSAEPIILFIGDLNLDGIINTGDTTVLANTLNEKLDEDN